jgi:hypothetical protein
VAHSPELGIDAEFRDVNLLEGGNFNPEFVKIVSDDCIALLSSG